MRSYVLEEFLDFPCLKFYIEKIFENRENFWMNKIVMVEYTSYKKYVEWRGGP